MLGLLLTGGQTKSCGCLSISHSERILEEYLMSKNVDFEMQYYPEGLVGVHGGKMHCDCVIYDAMKIPRLLIELDGIQHYQPVTYFGGQPKYLSVCQNDMLKNEWAKKSNIPLVRIDVSKCTTDDSFLKCYNNNLINVLN